VTPPAGMLEYEKMSSEGGTEGWFKIAALIFTGENSWLRLEDSR